MLLCVVRIFMNQTLISQDIWLLETGQLLILSFFTDSVFVQKIKKSVSPLHNFVPLDTTKELDIWLFAII